MYYFKLWQPPRASARGPRAAIGRASSCGILGSRHGQAHAHGLIPTVEKSVHSVRSKGGFGQLGRPEYGEKFHSDHDGRVNLLCRLRICEDVIHGNNELLRGPSRAMLKFVTEVLIRMIVSFTGHQFLAWVANNQAADPPVVGWQSGHEGKHHHAIRAARSKDCVVDNEKNHQTETKLDEVAKIKCFYGE
ncbi:hypothetical protein EI94DRAFT_1702155 [Lactarius quietus]|nr:hypothetical protein EI94DRAFT_1702155 [Lactarius quietus]